MRKQYDDKAPSQAALSNIDAEAREMSENTAVDRLAKELKMKLPE